MHSSLTRRSAIIAAAASLAALSVPALADGLDVSGTWDSTAGGDGGGPYTIKLTQVNSTVTGTYEVGSGLIDGKLSGNKLAATWKQAGSDGWLTFNFTADGKAFDGEWGYHGAKPAGNWIGKKKPS